MTLKKSLLLVCFKFIAVLGSFIQESLLTDVNILFYSILIKYAFEPLRCNLSMLAS